MEVFVANVDEFRSGTRQLIRAGRRNVAVFHYHGQFFAIDNACYHHGGPLLMGDIEELGGHPCVICPWHSYRIALDTGEGLYWGISVPEGGGAPKQSLKSKGKKQRCHRVYVREGKVYCFVEEVEPRVESDTYATMPIANADLPTAKPVSGGGGGSSGGLHSGLRSGHVLAGGAASSGAEVLHDAAVSVRCVRVIPRCAGVSSFVFEKVEGVLSKRLDAGMWVTLGLPVRVDGYENRSYTVTHVRSDGGWFTITVKCEMGGRGGSRWLHEAGESLLSLTLPLVDVGGTFTIARQRSRINNKRGLLLAISAGVGVTPIFASLNTFLNDQFTLSAGPPLHVVHVHVDRSESTTPFLEQFTTWQRLFAVNDRTKDPVTYRFRPYYTREGRGRPPPDEWSAIVQNEFGGPDLTVMMCGPPTFMADTREVLMSLGVAGTYILTESFE